MTRLGTVYVLHFDPPLTTAGHYIGWTVDLKRRLRVHRAGRGARLTRRVVAAGGALIVVATYPGTQADERRMKRRGAKRYCSICRA